MSTKQPKSTTFKHRAGQFHAHRKVFQLEHALLEHRGGQVFARIASGAGQLGQDVPQRQRAHAQFPGQGLDVHGRNTLGQRRDAFLCRQVGRRAAQSFQHAGSRRIALRMNPGAVQRIVAAADFQESGRLDESRFAEAGHLAKLLPIAKRAALAAELVHPPGGQLVQARTRIAATPGWRVLTSTPT